MAEAVERKALKEEKKRKKLEKFLSKKTAAVQVAKPKGEYRGGGYDPCGIEGRWYGWWESQGLFRPVCGGERYVIAMPPPNVTGNLHIGHAMMVSIQDTLCRYKRMCGYEVVYIPGTDHAGISTQSVVCRQMERDGESVSRERFLERTWEWKEKHGTRIYEQFKRLGTSVDFSRERFTLDPKMNEAVVEAFVRLYKKGLVYREPKIVNWCGKLSTTLSDLEVNHEEVGPNTFVSVDGGRYEFGVLYYFRYPITTDRDFDGDVRDLPHVEVATTRPETILGDTAICVNGKDTRFTRERMEERFGRAIGPSKVYGVNPLTGEVIPLIFDEHVDMDFGTGVLKVTPAHDGNDFELSKKHELRRKVVLDGENRICVSGEFKGLRRFDARKAVVERLVSMGLFVEKRGYGQTIPVCSRSGDVIEPMVKSQWWLRCKEMASQALSAVRDGRITIHPPEAEKQWDRWLENIRDWCLSRQLWWGHRIPAYQTRDGRWYVGRNKEEAMRQARHEHAGHEYSEEEFEQDPDVLDTWFSSGLWPFAILGWPENTSDFMRYYPTTLLETGSDILFFWVARMVMLGIELTGREPFRQIVLHGIVRDAHGRKMSKSLGNVIDPIFVIDGCPLPELIATMKSGNLDSNEVKRAEAVLRKDFPNGIPKCGADALRFALLSYTLGMKDINLDILRVEGYRRFCNKIWNAQKFVKMVVDEAVGRDGSGEVAKESYRQLVLSLDKLAEMEGDGCIGWILGRRNEAIESIRARLEGFNFMGATQTVHGFFLHDVCDVFIEIVKTNKTQRYIEVLLTVFIDCMKMFHPFMPFISEEIFSHYFGHSISTSSYPRPDGSEHSSQFPSLIQVVRHIKSVVSLHHYERAVVEIVPGTSVCKADLVFIKPLCRMVSEVRVVEEIRGKPFEDVDGSQVSICGVDGLNQ